MTQEILEMEQATPGTRYAKSGLQDIVASLRAWPQWLTLGWYDFRIQHRRTLIGPIWQFLQAGVWVAGLSMIFGIFGRGHHAFMAYVAAGVVLWNFICSSIISGSNVFAQNSNLILNINNPMATYPMRLLVRMTLRVALQFPVVIIAGIICKVPFNFTILLAVPGFAVILINAFWMMLLFGVIGTRYRDTSFALESVTRFLFFMSPVFWVPKEGTLRGTLATYNPITYFLEIAREPLIGALPSLQAWSIVGAITIVGLALAVVVYNRFQQSVVFWL